VLAARAGVGDLATRNPVALVVQSEIENKNKNKKGKGEKLKRHEKRKEK
jgi:hypothetical protein